MHRYSSISQTAVSPVHSEKLRLAHTPAVEYFSSSCVSGTQRESQTRAAVSPEHRISVSSTWFLLA